MPDSPTHSKVLWPKALVEASEAPAKYTLFVVGSSEPIRCSSIEPLEKGWIRVQRGSDNRHSYEPLSIRIEAISAIGKHNP